MAIEIVDFPIKNGDFPVRNDYKLYVNNNDNINNDDNNDNKNYDGKW